MAAEIYGVDTETQKVKFGDDDDPEFVYYLHDLHWRCRLLHMMTLDRRVREERTPSKDTHCFVVKADNGKRNHHVVIDNVVLRSHRNIETGATWYTYGPDVHMVCYELSVPVEEKLLASEPLDSIVEVFFGLVAHAADLVMDKNTDLGAPSDGTVGHPHPIAHRVCDTDSLVGVANTKYVYKSAVHEVGRYINKDEGLFIMFGLVEAHYCSNSAGPTVAHVVCYFCDNEVDSIDTTIPPNEYPCCKSVYSVQKPSIFLYSALSGKCNKKSLAYKHAKRYNEKTSMAELNCVLARNSLYATFQYSIISAYE